MRIAIAMSSGLASIMMLMGGCGTDEGAGGGQKTVTLGTKCFMFETGKEGDYPKNGECDLGVEPWCNGKAGICGNWIQTDQIELDAVTTPPATGYISDDAGYTDCQEVDTGKVIVFKLSDGSFAKGIFSNLQKDKDGCVTGITFTYVYPM